MTAAERTRADAEALLDAIRLDWQDLTSKNLTHAERTGIRTHIDWAVQELGGLLQELDRDDA